MVDEWIKKLGSISLIEYYLAVREDRNLQFAATCMELEGFMLSEISQRGMKNTK